MGEEEDFKELFEEEEEGQIELPPKEFYNEIRNSKDFKELFPPKERTILNWLYQGLEPEKVAELTNQSLFKVQQVMKKFAELYNVKQAQEDEEEPQELEQEEKPKLIPSKPTPSDYGIDIPEPEPEPKKKGRKKKQENADSGKTTKAESYSRQTTTFKEIDKLISRLLAPQVERSTAWQEVMARIGELTAYSLLQLGLVERETFVQLAEKITESPEALYEYVKSGLDALIAMTDEEKLKKLFNELISLRAKSYALELELEDYKRWFQEAQQMLQFLLSILTEEQKEDFAMWLFTMSMLKSMKVPARG